MKPDLESSRSFAMTLAHRAVRDVRRDGFRQLRNYVDMCALLAQRPDLKRFFDHAQTVLQRTDSLYYKLINNLVAQVNEDAICTAGINLGFDAIISCASNNRKQNGETRSWLNVGFCSAPELDDAIIQAEAGSMPGCCMRTRTLPRKRSPCCKAIPTVCSLFCLMPRNLMKQPWNALRGAIT
jgi:hypothetical protein